MAAGISASAPVCASVGVPGIVAAVDGGVVGVGAGGGVDFGGAEAGGDVVGVDGGVVEDVVGVVSCEVGTRPPGDVVTGLVGVCVRDGLDGAVVGGDVVFVGRLVGPQCVVGWGFGVLAVEDGCTPGG